MQLKITSQEVRTFRDIYEIKECLTTVKQVFFSYTKVLP